jgi:hypothetical protein
MRGFSKIEPLLFFIQVDMLLHGAMSTLSRNILPPQNSPVGKNADSQAISGKIMPIDI